MGSFTDVFGGQITYPSQLTYLALALTADVTLVWATEQAVAGATVMADIMDLTPDAAGRVVTLPDATVGSNGASVLFNNLGADPVTIKNSAGGTIGSVDSGEQWQFYLADNSTVAGTWRTFQFGAGTSSAVAAALAGAGLKAILNTLNLQYTPRSSAISPLVVGDSDRAKIVQWTGGVGSMTLPDPAVVGSDWFTMVRNNGSGTLTITPTAGLLDGSASAAFSPLSSAIIYCDGTDFYTIGLGDTGSTGFDFTTINVAGTGDYVLSGATELNRISYELTGALTGARNIIVPDTVQQYWINNQTSGAFDLTVKTDSGSGIVVPQGQARILYCDGFDVIDAVTIESPMPVEDGGTGLTSVAQGDLLYGSAPNVYSLLNKSATATRYLSNTGASNNPAWSAVDLTNGVTGRLPFANIAQLAGLSVAGVPGGSTADLSAITAGAAGAVLRANSGLTAIAFGPVDLTSANAVTGALPVGNAGTGITGYVQGDIIYASAGTTLARLAKSSSLAMFLSNSGTTNNPAWARIQYTALGTNSDYTFALTDSALINYHTGAPTQVWTIPLNSSVAFPIGTHLPIANALTGGNLTITPTGGVTLFANGQLGAFVLPPGYSGVLLKVDTNAWTYVGDLPVTAGVGVDYAGWIQSGAASSLFNTAAAAWTVSNPATGQITVTHNLGLSSAHNLAVTAQIIGPTGDDRTIIVNPGTNSFDVFTADVGGGGGVDVDIFVRALRIA